MAKRYTVDVAIARILLNRPGSEAIALAFEKLYNNLEGIVKELDELRVDLDDAKKGLAEVKAKMADLASGALSATDLSTLQQEVKDVAALATELHQAAGTITSNPSGV